MIDLLKPANPFSRRLSRTGMLCIHDLRHVFRDKVMITVAIAPLLMIGLLRWGLPFAEAAFPVISPHKLLIVALLCLSVAVLPAYLVSFIILEEKDEQILSAIRVLPIHPAAFLGYRVGLMTVLGFGVSWLLIRLAASELIPVGPDILLSLLSALGAPVVCLFVVTFAQNKIEGVTLLKGLNFVATLPILSFFAAESWQYIAACVPFYWLFRAFREVASPSPFGQAITIGIIFHLLLIGLLFRLFRRRVF